MESRRPECKILLLSKMCCRKRAVLEKDQISCENENSDNENDDGEIPLKGK